MIFFKINYRRLIQPSQTQLTYTRKSESTGLESLITLLTDGDLAADDTIFPAAWLNE